MIIQQTWARDLDICRDGGLVSALAFNSRWKTSYRNTLALFRDISSRLNIEWFPLIATDGFAFHIKVVRRVLRPACLYGQVIKTRGNDRGAKVEQRAVIGVAWRFEQALCNSEDSFKLNASFIERLNLTIRHDSAVIVTADEFSDDEYAEITKPNRRLHKEVT